MPLHPDSPNLHPMASTKLNSSPIRAPFGSRTISVGNEEKLSELLQLTKQLLDGHYAVKDSVHDALVEFGGLAYRSKDNGVALGSLQDQVKRTEKTATDIKSAVEDGMTSIASSMDTQRESQRALSLITNSLLESSRNIEETLSRNNSYLKSVSDSQQRHTGSQSASDESKLKLSELNTNLAHQHKELVSFLKSIKEDVGYDSSRKSSTDESVESIVASHTGSLYDRLSKRLESVESTSNREPAVPSLDTFEKVLKTHLDKSSNSKAVGEVSFESVKVHVDKSAAGLRKDQQNATDLVKSHVDKSSEGIKVGQQAAVDSLKAHSDKATDSLKAHVDNSVDSLKTVHQTTTDSLRSMLEKSLADIKADHGKGTSTVVDVVKKLLSDLSQRDKTIQKTLEELKAKPDAMSPVLSKEDLEKAVAGAAATDPTTKSHLSDILSGMNELKKHNDEIRKLVDSTNTKSTGANKTVEDLLEKHSSNADQKHAELTKHIDSAVSNIVLSEDNTPKLQNSLQEQTQQLEKSFATRTKDLADTVVSSIASQSDKSATSLSQILDFCNQWKQTNAGTDESTVQKLLEQLAESIAQHTKNSSKAISDVHADVQSLVDFQYGDNSKLKSSLDTIVQWMERTGGEAGVAPVEDVAVNQVKAQQLRDEVKQLQQTKQQLADQIIAMKAELTVRQESFTQLEQRVNGLEQRLTSSLIDRSKTILGTTTMALINNGGSQPSQTVRPLGPNDASKRNSSIVRIDEDGLGSLGKENDLVIAKRGSPFAKNRSISMFTAN